MLFPRFRVTFIFRIYLFISPLPAILKVSLFTPTPRSSKEVRPQSVSLSPDTVAVKDTFDPKGVWTSQNDRLFF